MAVGTGLRNAVRVRFSGRGPSVASAVYGAGAAICAAYFVSRVESGSLELVLPLCTLLAIGLAFAIMLQRLSTGRLQFLELGLVFVGCIVLYGGYPLASFLISGQTFTDLGDVRLYDAQPRSSGKSRSAANPWIRPAPNSLHNAPAPLIPRNGDL